MWIAYVHGFLSGPNAVKAYALKAYIDEHESDLHFWALDFPDTPARGSCLAPRTA